KHHRSCSILTGGNHSLEIGIFHRVILRPHREALYRGIERGALGHGPREEYAAPLQAQIIVQVRGHVLLHSVNERSIHLFLSTACALWLRRRSEVALLAVFIEFHIHLKPGSLTTRQAP